ncbi:HEAT repeat protein [Catellatospora citrea]|nr:HEAT repeat protein [Catellatospora citrea]
MVRIEPLTRPVGEGAFDARVARLDAAHDLAVLRTSVEGGLGASVPGLVEAEGLARGTSVVVSGMPYVEDPGNIYRDWDAPGLWAGGATRNDLRWGQLSNNGVVPGMSGAPVLVEPDNFVVGVVSGRYNSADGWVRDRVWAARVEDLVPLLVGLAPVKLLGGARSNAEPLVIGPLNTGYAYGTTALTIDASAPVLMYAAAMPAGVRKEHAASVDFDLTNLGKVDVRVDRVDIRVLEFYPVDFLDVTPLTAAVDIRRYSCVLDGRPGNYECRSESATYDYIKLASGELERFSVTLQVPTPGVYRFTACVRYSVAGHLKTVEYADAVTLGFFDDRGNRSISSDIQGRLLTILEHEQSPSQRSVAALHLAKFGRPEAIPELLHLLEHEHRDYLRSDVAEALAIYRSGEVTEALVAALGNKSRMVRRSAAKSLGTIGDPSSIPYLERYLGGGDVVTEAAEALGLIGDESAVAALGRALEDENEGVRQAVTSALSHLGDRAIPLLDTAVNDPNQNVRWRAILVLGELKSSAAMARLVGALTDDDSHIRSGAASRLGWIKDTSAMSALRVALRNDTPSAGAALAHLDPPDIDGLLAAANESDTRTLLGVAWGLSELAEKLERLPRAYEKRAKLIATRALEMLNALEAMADIDHEELSRFRSRGIRSIRKWQQRTDGRQ